MIMRKFNQKKIDYFIKCFLSILFIFFSNFSIAQSKWKVFHEDKNIKIEYQINNCHEDKNSYNFSYYMIKIVNKNTKSLNVRYNFTDNNTEEDSFSFILKPSESIEGKCNSEVRFLKKYVEKSETIKPFKLFNIKVYEL